MKYPRYQKSRSSGIEWIGDVPEGWTLKPLKRAAAINPDVLSEETEPDHEIDYVDIGDVSQIGGIGSSSRMPFSAAPSRARRRVRHGDTILSTVRTYLKAVAYIESPPENRIVSTGFACLRPERTFSPKFLSRCVQADEFIGLVVSRSVGVSYPAISPTVLGSIPVPCPPLPEQEAIDSFLDAKTARIDSLIAKKERLLELLEERRVALSTHAATKGLAEGVPMRESGIPAVGMIPAHWRVKRNRFLFREINARSGDGREDLLTVSHKTGVSLRSERPDVTMFLAESLEDYKICNASDLVINTMWAWMGALGFSPRRGAVSPSYNVYRLQQPESVRYLDYLYRTRPYVCEYRRHSTGVWESRLRLYPAAFGQMLTLLPPRDEQDRIADYLDAVTEHAEALTARVHLAIDRLREYRNALISAAVTGKIDVRNLTPTTPCQ